VKKGWHWPAIIVAFLLGDVVAMGITVAVSSGDPSHYVIPDYYQKAVKHDEVIAQERHRLELGWNLTVARVAPTDQGVDVDFALTDRDAKAVLGAKGTVQAFHQARAAKAHALVLEDVGAGIYRAHVPVRKAGLWDLDVTIEHAEGSFTVRLQKDLR